ncbi:hypothetical protein B0J14DRAFT_60820 [Halenospora varia]|nr:hypothetical protein B0J14DRAFT_60820 [Halenospora varia]
MTTTMMSTSPTATISSLRGNSSPISICGWPLPELSIGERSGSIGFLGKYKCWKVKDKSPAHEIWKKVSKPILELLEDQFEHLEAKDQHLQIEIFMIGKGIATACPTILFSCLTKTCRQRAMELVEKCSILAPYPGVRTAACSKMPRPLAKDMLPTPWLAGVYASGPVHQMGVSILVVRENGSLPRRATMGGIITLNKRRYGVTVKHVFEDTLDFPCGEESGDDEFEFFGSDNQGEIHDEFDSVEITSHGSISSNSTPSKASDVFDEGDQYCHTPTATGYECETDLKGWELSSIRRIGDIPDINFTDTCSDLALIHLDSQINLSSEYCANNTHGQFLNEYAFTNHTNCHAQEIASQPSDVDVYVFTKRNAQPLQGRLSGLESYMKLPGHSTFQAFWTVTIFNGLLDIGDSGAWVVDNEHRLYGHLTSGSPDGRIAHIIPAVTSFGSIFETFISPQERLLWPRPKLSALNSLLQDSSTDNTVFNEPTVLVIDTGPPPKSDTSAQKSYKTPSKASGYSSPYSGFSGAQSNTTCSSFPSAQEYVMPQPQFKADFTPEHNVTSVTSNVLYLRNLPPMATRDHLKATFSQQSGYVDLSSVSGAWHITFTDSFSATEVLQNVLIPQFGIKGFSSPIYVQIRLPAEHPKTLAAILPCSTTPRIPKRRRSTLQKALPEFPKSPEFLVRLVDLQCKSPLQWLTVGSPSRLI